MAPGAAWGYLRAPCQLGALGWNPQMSLGTDGALPGSLAGGWRVGGVEGRRLG